MKKLKIALIFALAFAASQPVVAGTGGVMTPPYYANTL